MLTRISDWLSLHAGLGRRQDGFSFLADCPPTGDAALARAGTVIDAIQKTIETRDGYIAANALDPALWAPTAHWGGVINDFACYRGLLAKDRACIDHLRRYAFMFTGTRLATMRPARPEEGTDADIASIDGMLRKLARKTDPSVLRYSRIARALPEDCCIAFPRVCGEVGWLLDGKIINPDTAVYIERVALMREAGTLQRLREISGERPPRILEISSGFGGLAYMLGRIFHGSQITLMDLPDSLAFAGSYLSIAAPDIPVSVWAANTPAGASAPGYTVLPNYAFPALCDAGASFDLVINTLSMSEMPSPQVEAYAAGIARLIGADGVFFEQNQDNRHLGLIWCKEIIKKHFGRRETVAGKSVPGVTQGRADMWRN